MSTPWAARGCGFAVLACCAAACASTAADGTHPDDAASVSMGQGLPRTAPACTSTGPTIVATVVGFLKGKPPHHTYEVDLHVRNPLAKPLWVAPTMEESMPLEVYAVSVLRSPWGQVGPLWSFGPGNLEAVRVAPGADFNLSGVQYETFSFDSSDLMVVAVLDEVRLDGRPAVEWVGRRTEAAAYGDIDVQSFRAREEIPAANGARLELQVRCTQVIDVRDPKLQR